MNYIWVVQKKDFGKYLGEVVSNVSMRYLRFGSVCRRSMNCSPCEFRSWERSKRNTLHVRFSDENDLHKIMSLTASAIALQVKSYLLNVLVQKEHAILEPLAILPFTEEWKPIKHIQHRKREG